MQPVGEVTDGVALGLYSSCGGHQFSFTTGGSLQHVGSAKCVNTKSGVSSQLFPVQTIFKFSVQFLIKPLLI